MDVSTPILACPACHQPVQLAWYFCPNCGYELHPKPVNVSVWAQTGIYALSLLLPPLGLYPAVKYLEKPGRQAKIVGATALVLTIVSSAIVIWLTFQYMNIYLSTFNSLNGL